MADLILEPYAVLQHWTIPDREVGWDSFLSEYLLALADLCQQQTGHFLGHIKALALISGDHYLRISVVDPKRPASVEGSFPIGLKTIELTLNVIVYGHSAAFLQSITDQTASEFARRWNGAVSSQKIHQHTDSHMS